MAAVMAFFTWIGLLFFGSLFIGTLATWFGGGYTGSVTQLLLTELIVGALTAMCAWGAARSWRRRQAMPPEQRSTLGMGCLVVTGAFIILFMGFFVTSSIITQRAVEDMKATTAPVIAALARYKDAKNEYPAKLETLVPDYLPAVPGCRREKSGPRLGYWREETTSHYSLSCSAFLFTWVTYRSATGQWEIGD